MRISFPPRRQERKEKMFSFFSELGAPFDVAGHALRLCGSHLFAGFNPHFYLTNTIMFG